MALMTQLEAETEAISRWGKPAWATRAAYLDMYAVGDGVTLMWESSISFEEAFIKANRHTIRYGANG